jgi:hypothetical protein
MHEALLLGGKIIKIMAERKTPIGRWKADARVYTDKDAHQLVGVNIALVLGEQWCLLDVEGPAKAVSGMQHLEHLELALGRLPETVTYKTPSGGRGYLFRASGERHCDLSQSVGIELRTGTHYCLLPPSHYTDERYSGSYEWMISPSEILDSEDEIPTLPEEWRSYFESQTRKPPELTVIKGDADYYQPQWAPAIRQDIYRIDPDCGYQQWWRIMAICHRAGCMDVFRSWSMQGKKYDDAAENQIDNADRYFDTRRSGLLVGFESFCEMVPAAEHPFKVGRVEDLKVMQIPTHSDILLNLKLEGLAQAISEEVARDLPEPWEYRIIAPLCVLATLAQRRIRVPRTVAMNYHLLAGGAGSRKSTLQQAVQELVRRVQPSHAMNRPASIQALQRLFSDCASRFLAYDEGIERLLTIYSPKAMHTPQQEMFTGVLEYFGSPRLVSGQENKKHEDSHKAAMSPRLTFLLCGVTEQFGELCALPKFFESGMASRLSPWLVNSPHEDIEEWWSSTVRGVEWSDSIVNKIKDHYGMYICSSDVHPTETIMNFADGCFEIFEPFWQEMQKLRDTDKDQESVWLRMRERALWYAGLHAWGCGRIDILPTDVEVGLTLCRYHVAVWKWMLTNGAHDELTMCMEAVVNVFRKHKIMTRGRIGKYITARFRGMANRQLRDAAIDLLIEERRITPSGKSLML